MSQNEEKSEMGSGDFFLKALNALVTVKDEAIANLQELIDTVCDTGNLALERDGIEQELIMMAEHIENLIRENARVVQDQEEYAKKEEKLRILYGEQTEFREELWGGLVDHIRVENEKTVTVVFRGGIEITV